MVGIDVYSIGGKYIGHMEVADLPTVGDRLVFADDVYTGYIVASREFRENDKAVRVKTHLDK